MYAKNIRPSATIESRTPGALKLASEARDENVPVTSDATLLVFTQDGNISRVKFAGNYKFSYSYL